MSVKFDFRKIEQSVRRLHRYMENRVPRIVGTEAVNHFKESFDNQAFTDLNPSAWKPAKRTRPYSPWFGFEAGARTRVPANHPRRGGKGKYKARKPNPITNYSPAAIRRKTLSGATGDLRDSIQYRIEGNSVFVFSNLPYAQVHNTGGNISVFGRKTTRLPQRQFIGQSIKLTARVKHLVMKDINIVLNT
ncbi:MAG TPA: phage virion morphogenesis protein [Dissulfurispiraceae bacterium]|nr:phage virion morphogenesis protein [Dissulfurispiraceae bacterium]